MKNILILFQHMPYATSNTQAQIDMIHAAYAFDIPFKLAFYQAGVLLLKTNFFNELSLYEIGACYVEKNSLLTHKINPNEINCPINLTDIKKLRQLMDWADWVVGS